jgi:hypothetical protein
MKQILQNQLRLLILSVGALFLTACSPGDFGLGGCTADLAQSVVLNVTDANLQPIDEYEVSYKIDEGEVQKVVCNPRSNCLPVYETGGNFAIRISKDGYESTSLDVFVKVNYCHVATRTIAVKLKSLI